MRKVLTRTLIGISISILINAIAYIITNDPSTKFSIILFGEIALLCAIPIILSYILTHYKHNAILDTINIILFMFNIFIFVLFSLLLASSAFLTPISNLNWGYLMIGYYVFYETLKDPNDKISPRIQKSKTSSEDILDDNL